MRLLEPTAQIWMKIDPYYQRQKCRPMNLGGCSPPQPPGSYAYDHEWFHTPGCSQLGSIISLECHYVIYILWLYWQYSPWWTKAKHNNAQENDHEYKCSRHRNTDNDQRCVLIHGSNGSGRGSGHCKISQVNLDHDLLRFVNKYKMAYTAILDYYFVTLDHSGSLLGDRKSAFKFRVSRFTVFRLRYGHLNILQIGSKCVFLTSGSKYEFAGFIILRRLAVCFDTEGT